MRWLLLDEVIGIEKGKAARTRSRVPNGVVSPEVLMTEMMAQTGGMLLGAETDFQQDLVFVKIEKASFSGDYKADDVLDIEVTSENLHPEGAWLDARIQSRNRTVAKSRLLLMEVSHLRESSAEPITFHAAFMNHFSVREKVSG
ncbi:MAG: hypothetical protein Q8R76_02520 [Candidatus Omnitrophota bacterium]|nr:hypothetical protein [Candidatus Omnitrophota bacterium]